MDSMFPELPTFATGETTLTVDPNEPNSIGSCIARAPPNSTIIVPAGEYKEGLTIDKDIQIIGEGEVILAASTPADSFTVNAQHVYVKNIQIKPGSSQCSSSVNLLSGSAVFESCTVTSPFMPPIVTHQEGLLYFNQCMISSTEAAIMYVSNNVKVEFRGCQISSPQTVGIIASLNSQVRMIGSALTKCGDSGLIILDRASLHMENSTVEENGADAIELNTQSQTNFIASSAIKGHQNGSALNCTGSGRLHIESCEINTCTAGLLAANNFTIESVNCQISNVTKSALVCATNGAHITLSGDTLSGCCLLGIISDSKSDVVCDKANFTDIATTGSSVTGGAKLCFNECTFARISQCAIEAHDDANLEVSVCAFSEVESIGILVQNNVRGFVRDTTIASCGIVGCHFVDNIAEFVFERVAFQGNGGNGLNIKNTNCTFTECAFIQNQSSGIEARGSNTHPVFNSCQFQQNALVGANITEGALPSFVACVFAANGNSGVCVQAAAPTFESCSLVQNGEMGIMALMGSCVSCTQCSIKCNNVLGAQIENQGTTVTFSQCELCEQPEGGGVIINEQGVGILEGCVLNLNNGPHVECRNSGHAKITNCDLSQSQKGVGMMLSLKGDAEVVSTLFHDEAQAGIVIGDEGNCNVSQCDLYGCQICAIYLLKGSQGTFTKNRIHDNNTVGIQVQDGSQPSILENTIENHSMYGINIALGAEPQVIDNIFNNNNIMDVNRE